MVMGETGIAQVPFCTRRVVVCDDWNWQGCLCWSRLAFEVMITHRFVPCEIATVIKLQSFPKEGSSEFGVKDIHLVIPTFAGSPAAGVCHILYVACPRPTARVAYHTPFC